MSFGPRFSRRIRLFVRRRFKTHKRRPRFTRSSFRTSHTFLKPSSMIFLIFLGFTVLTGYLGYTFVNHQLKPVLVSLAEEEAKKTAQKAFLKGIEEMQQKVNPVATLQVDKQNRITGVQFNSQMEAKAYQVVTQRILKELSKDENRMKHISFGKILQSSIFADLGPDIPVHIWVEGTPHVTFTSSIEGKGINTTLITVNLQAVIEMQSLLPLTNEHYTLKFNQPIARQVIVGEVPDFYPFDLNSIPQND
jgi:sporulation protein YunB